MLRSTGGNADGFVGERRQDNGNRHTDLGDTLDTEPEDDLVFTVMQMKTNTLRRVDEAARNFDDGTYGICVDCRELIASSRLRAMPFAVRCRHCEETHEAEHRRRLPLPRVPVEASLGC